MPLEVPRWGWRGGLTWRWQFPRVVRNSRASGPGRSEARARGGEAHRAHGAAAPSSQLTRGPTRALTLPAGPSSASSPAMARRQKLRSAPSTRQAAGGRPPGHAPRAGLCAGWAGPEAYASTRPAHRSGNPFLKEPDGRRSVPSPDPAHWPRPIQGRYPLARGPPGASPAGCSRPRPVPAPEGVSLRGRVSPPQAPPLRACLLACGLPRASPAGSRAGVFSEGTRAAWYPGNSESDVRSPLRDPGPWLACTEAGVCADPCGASTSSREARADGEGSGGSRAAPAPGPTPSRPPGVRSVVRAEPQVCLPGRT